MSDMELWLIIIVILVLGLVFIVWELFMFIRRGIVVVVKSDIELVVEAPDDVKVKAKGSSIQATEERRKI